MVGGVRSNNNNSNNNGLGLGLKEIPMGSRKMVMSLKEIVNCPEAEIYATLKDCNMDPNEAVNRLLSQDPFHEVKSKREKKKENKDTTEARSRGTSNRGGRSGTDRYGRGGSTQFSSESGASHGKAAYKKDSGSASYTGSLSSAPGVVGHTNKRPPAVSDAAYTENKVSAVSTVDGMSPAPQPSTGYQPAWVAVPGQMSMADVVKMGKPQNKAPGASNTSHHNVQGPSSTSLHQNSQFRENYASKTSDVNPPSGVSAAQHGSIDDEWPLIEPSSVSSVPPVPEPSADTKLHPDASTLPYDRTNMHDQTDDIQAVNDGAIENLSANHVESASVSSMKMQEDNPEGAYFDEELYENMGSYQPCHVEHNEVQEAGASVSSATENLQQLNIQEDSCSPPEGNVPSVVIPDHLQVQTADCSHLSFGSFKVGAAFSAPLASMPVKTNLEEPTTQADASAIGDLEARNSEYYGDESFRNASDDNLYHRAGASSANYESTSASQQEALKAENPEIERGNQYAYPTSTPGYTFENSQQVNVAFSQSQTGSQTQDHAQFSNVLQAYTTSLPSTLLAANVHPGRESDVPYSPFPMAQSMPAKYGSTVSSISGSALSMPEALKNVGFSSAQPSQQSLSGTSVATGPTLPQHLAVHPYSQPTLPLGPFANMISYPFLHQSYTYVPNAFQQAFAGNSTYHQSLAAVLPQYKNSASVSSLPQSATVASGYGAFGNTTTIPGNFPMNPPAAPSGTTLSYDDVLGSQYKDNSHLMSLQQQNDNSAMWLQGSGSRTMSAVPASTYYSFQGQNQQVGGFRQGQQPSQNYGTLGYPNFYHSQTGISMDHQQQNPREASLGGSQGQPKQSQQIWQNGY